VAGGATLWRLAVPQTAPPMALPGEHLLEWGGAQRWVVTSAPAAGLRDAAQRVGGHATAFRGGAPGDAFAPVTPALMKIHQGLKHAFDPDRLFNPGRLYPEL
jgi:glycolate oxidase FAD binding subunit